MEELLAAEKREDQLRPLRAGETVRGTVASISGDEATIDLGDRPAGVISVRESVAELQVGATVVATVVQPEGPDGRVVLAVPHTPRRREWDRMEELQRSGALIEAPVIEANRGGLVVDVGLRGFVPLSQLSTIGVLDLRAQGVPQALRATVGRRLRLRVLEVDTKRDRLILSEKAATQQLRRERKTHAAETLRKGDALEGRVVSVASYGIFVDVGPADGLVHRSEITWEKGVEPTSRYAVGESVRVVVIDVDRERQRISLSIKRLAEDPWEGFMRTAHVGETIHATVTRVMPYGAFARVADGVEGLIHVSELSQPDAGERNGAARAGDVLLVKIVAIDTERRRLSLSARLAERA